ncbi:MAG: hypothetical protein K0A94_09240 [Desulfuromonadales bacterium]|nr:hypothetical protein [Desulfuromonadales bacterium]
MLKICLDENLNIWTVADECAKEFPETTRFLWLVAMAKAIYAEPPALKLEPDETWDKVTNTNRKRFTQSPRISLDGEVWGYRETATQRNHRRMAEQMTNPPEVIREKYDPDNSPLKKLTEPLTSTKEPPGINARTFKEKIHREHFRAWCLSAGYDLPRFWFGSKTVAPTEQTPPPAEQMEALKKTAHEKAVEYATTAREGSIPIHVIIKHIEDEYAFKGTTLHDIIWPERSSISGANKRKRLSDYRKCKRNNQ